MLLVCPEQIPSIIVRDCLAPPKFACSLLPNGENFSYRFSILIHAHFMNPANAVWISFRIQIHISFLVACNIQLFFPGEIL